MSYCHLPSPLSLLGSLLMVTPESRSRRCIVFPRVFWRLKCGIPKRMVRLSPFPLSGLSIRAYTDESRLFRVWTEDVHRLRSRVPRTCPSPILCCARSFADLVGAAANRWNRRTSPRSNCDTRSSVGAIQTLRPSAIFSSASQRE